MSRAVGSVLQTYLNTSSEPLYCVVIKRRATEVNPYGGAQEWPVGASNPGGDMDPENVRVFTSRETQWTSRATFIAAYSLDEGRLSKAMMGPITTEMGRPNITPGGLAGAATFTFSLDNTDGGLAGRAVLPAYNGVVFDGHDIEVWVQEQTYAGIVDYNDSWPSSLLFYGRINEAKVGKDKVTIRAELNPKLYAGELPPKVFKVEDYPSLPEQTKNRPVPLVFGAHDMAKGFVVNESYNTGAADKGRQVVFADTDAMAIDSIDFLLYGDSGLEDIGGFAVVKNAAVEDFSETSVYTNLIASGGAYFDDIDVDYLYLFIDIKPKAFLEDTPYFNLGTNLENACDEDTTTKADLDNSASTSPAGMAFFVPAMHVSDAVIQWNASTETAGIFFLGKYSYSLPHASDWLVFHIGDSTQNGASGVGNSILGRSRHSTGSGSVDDYSTPDPKDANQFRLFQDGLWDNDYGPLDGLGELYVKATLQRNLASGTATVDLYAFMLRVYFYIDFPTSGGFYADMSGHKDPDGSYSGTSGLLLQNPLHICNALIGEFQKDGDLVLAGDGVTNYQRGNSDRSNWLFAKNIVDREDLWDEVKAIAEDGAFWVHPTTDGIKFSCLETGTGSSLPISRSDILNGELDSFEKTRIESILTDIEVLYNYNPIRDEFDGSLRVAYEHDGTTGTNVYPSDMSVEYAKLCHWAFCENGGRQVKKTFELSWVRDRTTAIRILETYLVFYTERRWIIRFTSDFKNLKLEAGDLFYFTELATGWPESYPAEVTVPRARDGGVLLYRVMKEKIDPKRDLIQYTAITTHQAGTWAGS